MKPTLLSPVIFLLLLFFMLSGTRVMAADNLASATRMRIFYSDNVQAELEPCG